MGVEVGEAVEVLPGAKPERIVGRKGVVASIHHFPEPHNFYEADVKFSDRHGDKYAVRTTRLKPA